MFRRKRKANIQDASDCVELMKYEAEQCRKLRIQMKEELSNAVSINDTLREQNEEYYKRYHEEIISHKRDIENIEKLMELNKHYCYLIPMLVSEAGLEIPENLDRTDLDQVKKLHDRLKRGIE